MPKKRKTTKRRSSGLKKKRATKKGAARKKVKLVTVPSTIIRDMARTLQALEKAFGYGVEIQKTWNKYMR